MLLINPPGRALIGRDGVICERKHCHPPLGLAYLAAMLEKNHYEVSVLDMLAAGYEQERYTEHFVYYGLTHEETAQRVWKVDPDLIGVSILFSNLAAEADRLVQMLRQQFPEKRIVLGGHHPSAMPRRMMANGDVDFVLAGEADLSLVQLCEALNGRGELGAVKGLYYREGGQIIESSGQTSPVLNGTDFKYLSPKDSPNPRSLEVVPFPAWHLLPMETYWRSDVRAGSGDVQRERFAVMVSTRGCPHACFFCTSPLMGAYRGYRRRKNHEVVREIRWLREEYGVEEIQFLDDNFFISAPRVKELCRALAAELPDMVFSVPAGTEVNALDDEMIELLAKAHFYRIILAIESASQDIHDEMLDKRVNLSRVPAVIEKIRNAGMEVRGFLMIGFPGEKRESILNTARYALSLDLDDFALSVVTPLPGTPLYEQCIAQNLLVDGFDPDDIRYSISTIKIEQFSRRRGDLRCCGTEPLGTSPRQTSRAPPRHHGIPGYFGPWRVAAWRQRWRSATCRARLWGWGVS